MRFLLLIRVSRFEREAVCRFATLLLAEFVIQEASSSHPALKVKMGNPQKQISHFGPSVEIRTRGLLNPIQARYQTSPHPDLCLRFLNA